MLCPLEAVPRTKLTKKKGKEKREPPTEDEHKREALGMQSSLHGQEARRRVAEMRCTSFWLSAY
jgi:hypothetical protein